MSIRWYGQLWRKHPAGFGAALLILFALVLAAWLSHSTDPAPASSLPPPPLTSEAGRAELKPSPSESPHLKSLREFYVALARAGYRFMGSSSPLDEVGLGLFGLHHISPPNPSPYQIEWRLTGFEFDEPLRSFLKVTSNQPCDADFRNAVLKEWDRTFGYLPSDCSVEGRVLLTNAYAIYHADIDGNAEADDFVPTEYCIIERGRDDFLKQYHLEVEHDSGDYVLKVILYDNERVYGYDAWCRVLVEFTYVGTEKTESTRSPPRRG